MRRKWFVGLGLVWMFFASVAICFSQTTPYKCVGPYTITTTEAKNWDFSGNRAGDSCTVVCKLNSGTFTAQVKASLDATSGDVIPKDRISLTALPALSASGFQQFDGPWNFVKLDVTAISGSLTYNICCKGN